jgi:hypothetical protein
VKTYKIRLSHMMFCEGNRNKLSVLGALQKQDRLNPAFISKSMGHFGNTSRKNMAQVLAYDVPIGVETSVIKDNQPIQQQIDETIQPENTALKVGMSRMVGDVSDTLFGGSKKRGGKMMPANPISKRYMLAKPKATGRIDHHGTGIFDKLQSAVDFVDTARGWKEGISDVAEAGTELISGPIGTWASNKLSEKFNKNPNWRSGFPGEKHAVIDTPWGMTRANYLGPGTNVWERLQRGDPPVDGSKGLDAAAKRHDISYGLARSADDVRKADNRFLKDLSNVESSTAMKNFVMGLFKAKKLAENIGFLDPARFAPDIKKEIVGMGLNKQMQKCISMSRSREPGSQIFAGTGFSGYSPEGGFGASSITMGAGLKEDIRDISKYITDHKKDLHEPLRKLRSIAFSVPGVQEKMEEIVEEFLPGQQLKQKLVQAAKAVPVKSSKGSSYNKKKARRAFRKDKNLSYSGKGFSSENVMMGTGVPKQHDFVGHILAGNVPKTYEASYSKSKTAFPKAKGAKISKGGSRKERGKKRKRTQEGGQLLASIIAGVVVPELVKFAGKQISKAIKKKKKPKKRKK